MSLNSVDTMDSILGYTLTDRIGAGGYGEVWKAIAPGGILKAMKIVYGFHDENRAQREMKSLNRMKELRHPFLLSLERIEVVDGRLVVVTELADSSLKERFDECVASGLPGIPREELLKYLQDAADALDFIRESHSLQHLDVKPENLLLVGGHVKVADFGLVKNIQETAQSMLSGLTPIYAPPELFDGRPSSSSDQYSLGIVYQEMLTGQRPFNGTTAAQLAGQHMHERPRLVSLPRGDQTPVQRALSKEPSARYLTCRAFIEDLKRRDSRREQSARMVRERSASHIRNDAYDHTMVIPEGDTAEGVGQPVVKKLGPLSVDLEGQMLRPTLFVGVGQTATNVLRRLKRRLSERLDMAGGADAFGILCIDTDGRDLQAATFGDSSDVLTSDETLWIPLRRPAEYRNLPSQRLAWIGRRWVYNVPRSLQTEGIRPLGRLAFVDHHEQIFDRLHDAMARITHPQTLQAITQNPNYPVEQVRPRVFIVGSTAGGVGSGCIVDMAYAVRTVLMERGYDDDVIGLLMHSSGRTATERDLTVANTYSCLTEMHHFSRAGGFPGDSACGLPSFTAGDDTFSSMYFVDLGSDLTQDEFDIATDSLAEYLYLNSAAKSSVYFDECRRDQSPREEMKVRTMGMCHSASFLGDLAALPTYVICHETVQRWIEPDELAMATVDPRATAAEYLREAGLTLEGILTHLTISLTEATRSKPHAVIDKVLRPICDDASLVAAQSRRADVLRRADEELAELFGSKSRSGARVQVLNLRSPLIQAVKQRAGEMAHCVKSRVVASLDRPGPRLWRAHQIHGELVVQMKSLLEEAVSVQQDVRREMDHVRFVLENLQDSGAAGVAAPGDSGQSTIAPADSLRNYGHLCLQEFLLSFCQQLISNVEQDLSELGSVVADVTRDVRAVGKEFEDEFVRAQRNASRTEGGESQLIHRVVTKKLRTINADLAAAVDLAVCDTDEDRPSCLHRLVSDRSRSSSEALAQHLYHAAFRMVTAELRAVDLEELFVVNGVKESELSAWLQRQLEVATPALLPKHGGDSRLIIAVPEGSNGDQFRHFATSQFKEEPAVLPATCGDVVVLYEVQDVPLRAIADGLLAERPECAEYVSRLQTRTDVDWTPISRTSLSS